MILWLTLLCGYFTRSFFFFVILIKLTSIHSASHRNTHLFNSFSQIIKYLFSVSVWFPVAVINTTIEGNLGKNEFISSYNSRSQSIAEEDWGEPMQKSPEKHCSLSCPSWHPQLSDTQLRRCFLRVALSTVGWALPQRSLIATLPHREAHRAIWPRQLKFPLPSYYHLSPQVNNS